MKTICLKCDKEFDDVNYKEEFKSAKRIYCDDCIDEMWARDLK